MGRNKIVQLFSTLFSLLIWIINSAYGFSAPDAIRKCGYPTEVHRIQSEDGYLLQYHRIPYGKAGPQSNKPYPYPILLHHGLLAASNDWIISGPEKSLSYRLADEGYDVWMANARGNTYSRSHISKNSKHKEYWNFSFHEMGVYDLPAAIDYILNITNNKKLIYIGHSLGTTIFYAFATTRPEYNDKILVHVGLAPVAILSHINSPIIKFLAKHPHTVESTIISHKNGSFLEHNDSWTQMLLKISNISSDSMFTLLYGEDIVQLNKTLKSKFTSYFPAGTSCKNIMHCVQLINSGRFRNYNYSIEENHRRYASKTPPVYDLNKISVPVKLYYGQNDILSTPTDVKLLYNQLPKPMGCTPINHTKWNHIDFFMAIDVNKLLNDQLLQFIKNVTYTPNFIMKTVENALKERGKANHIIL